MAATRAVSAAMAAAIGRPSLLASGAPPATAVEEPTWVVVDDAGRRPGGLNVPLSASAAVARVHADASLTAMPTVAFAGVGL